ncbi:MAG: hypothetical protein LBJ98_01155, partial [Endomicrobium sp.]|jgi:hypothetical protein|nr:hypothetical protein [Endomicrobium sp.]
MFSGMMGKLAAAFSAAAVVKFGVMSAKAYGETKRSADALTASLKAVGITSNAAMKDFEDFAIKLRDVSGISKEASFECLRLAANFGIYGEKAKETTRAAHALSLGLWMDLNSAMMLLVKASEGNVSALSRYGLQINKTGNAGKDFEKVLKVVEDRFGELAGADSDNLITKTRALKEEWKEFAGLVGKTITPALEKILGVASKALKALSPSKELIEEEKYRHALERRAEIVKRIEEKQGKNKRYAANKSESKQLEKLEKIILKYEEAKKAIKETEEAEAKKLKMQTVAAEKLKELNELKAEQEKGINEKLSKEVEEVNRSRLNAQAKMVKEYLEKRADTEKLYGSARIEFYRNEADRLIETHKYSAKQVEAIEKGMQEAIIEKIPTFREAWKKALEELSEDSISTTEIMKSGFNSLMNGFESMGEALASGEDGFKAYAKAGVMALGEVVSALATQIQAKAFVALLDKDYGAFGQGMASAAALKVVVGAIKASAGSISKGSKTHSKDKAGKYARGGIVGKVSGVASTGDKHIAAVNPGELILNEAQQGTLYKGLMAASEMLSKAADFARSGNEGKRRLEPVEIRVINNAGADVGVSKREYSNDRSVDILIEKKVGEYLSSPKGANVMSSVYGVSRQGIRNR